MTQGKEHDFSKQFIDTGLHYFSHAIHRAGQDWDFELQRLRILARQTPPNIDFVRINRHAAGDECDFVEPVGHASFSISADPHSHN